MFFWDCCSSSYFRSSKRRNAIGERNAKCVEERKAIAEGHLGTVHRRNSLDRAVLRHGLGGPLLSISGERILGQRGRKAIPVIPKPQ